VVRFFLACMKNKQWSWWVCLPGLLVVLSSCSLFGGETPPQNPPAWTNYQGKDFTMNYFSNWDIGTKDLYLGTSYPQLELLQGTSIIKHGVSLPLVQVVHANNPGGGTTLNDILLKFILGSPKKPVATTSLTSTTLAGESWSQGSVEKQMNVSNGSNKQTVSVKETALGINHTVAPNKTEIYIIILQDAASTYDKTDHDTFERMVKSFHFAS